MSKQISEQISESTCHVALRIDVFIHTTRLDFGTEFYSLYCIQRVRPWILLHMHSLYACPLRVFLKFAGYQLKFTFKILEFKHWTPVLTDSRLQNERCAFPLSGAEESPVGLSDLSSRDNIISHRSCFKFKIRPKISINCVPSKFSVIL